MRKEKVKGGRLKGKRVKVEGRWSKVKACLPFGRVKEPATFYRPGN